MTSARPDSGKPAVLLNYGLGVDSTAILVRWLTDPSSRDFDLDDLVVVTAMTGNEWHATPLAVEGHVLPLLAASNVRYVQVARAGYSARDGVAVLDDSLSPATLHAGGAYPLAAELLANGMVPMSAAGLRTCSSKQKGAVIKAALPRLVGDREFRNVLGFCVGEERRARRGDGYDYPGRVSQYPLLEWGWTREDSQAYLERVLGVRWEKSACVFCPFAFSHAGVEQVLERYLAQPDAGVLALRIEYGARCVNPSQTLLVGRSLREVFDADSRFAGIVAAFDRLREATPHALLHVRRVVRGPVRCSGRCAPSNAAPSHRGTAPPGARRPGTQCPSNATT